MNCNNANNISIYNLLLEMGVKCKKHNSSQAWFLSPFRKETIASFKVSKQLNRWYDHGEGIGGNTIDLITRLNNCSVKEALSILNEKSFSFHQQEIFTYENKPGFKVLKKQNLQNEALINYLDSRGISYTNARVYCFELYYRVNGKDYFAIAFNNNSGGMELRNKYFKGCTGSKDFTTINNESRFVKVFEGFIDFLTYLELYPKEINSSDYLVCNSTALIRKILPELKRYSSIDLYLDNDTAGKKVSSLIIQYYSQASLKNHLYAEYKDLNEMWMKNV
ncbi:toprim domain-containing protein [Salegentibacter sp. Hel_I_6]|uniref:toprim domain-containing protein n=1 Tax=Salegentibacter sp. Hel_I_6 TaxID=1250278 RepID=UPI00055CB424|nr:toprim domain-containing protein [Salegentibacter sp. Hel_I_6]